MPKPIINGTGFDFKEVQVSEERINYQGKSIFEIYV